MKRTWTTNPILALAFLLLFAVSALLPGAAYAQPDVGRIFDDKDVLTTGELQELNDMAAAIYDDYGVDVFFCICDLPTEEETDAYASALYERHQQSSSSILLLINEDWGVYNYQYNAGAAEIFSEADQDAMLEAYEIPDTYYDGIEGYLLASRYVLETLAAGDHARPVAPIPSTSSGSPGGYDPYNLIALKALRLMDNADLLTDAEEVALLARLDEISERQGCGVIIVTTPDLQGVSASTYADDYFNYNGYGEQADASGILFLLAMADRDWAISTHGYGVTAFTDAGQKYLMDQILPDLKNDNYNAALTKFANLSDEFLTQAYTGAPYDRDNLPKGSVSPFWIFGSLGMGGGLSTLIMRRMKSSLAPVRPLRTASSYLIDENTSIVKGRETFLYRNTTNTPRPKATGSSTHTSSSGRTHGGSSGKF